MRRRQLFPLEWRGRLVVGGDKVVNGLSELARRSEAGTTERLAGENAEPTFHLVQPGRVGGSEVKLDVGVALEPAVLFGLVRVQIVQHDVDLAVRVFGNDAIHKLQKLTATAAAIVCRLHLPRSDLKSGEQGRGAVTLVAATESVHGFPIRQAQESLRSFQRLNGSLLWIGVERSAQVRDIAIS